MTLSLLSSLGMVAIHLAAALVSPPEGHPGAITTALSVYAFGHFLLAYLAYNVLQWRCAGSLEVITLTAKKTN